MPNLLLRNFLLAHQADRFYVVALVATNVVSAAVDLSALLIFARLIDLFVVYAQQPAAALSNEVWVWFGALVVRWMLMNLFGHFRDYLNDVHKPKVVDYTDNIIISKLDRLPTAVIESSDFQNTMTNVHTFGKVKFVENLELVSALVQAVARFVYALGALLISNPWLAALILVISLPEVKYNLKLVRKMRELNETLALERRRRSYFASLAQDISQYFTLKSYNLFGYFLTKIDSSQQTILSGVRDIQRYHKPRSIAIGTIANLAGQFAPKAYYVWATLQGWITIGQFQLFYRLIDEAYSNSYWLYSNYLQISENNVYVKDLFALLDMPEEQQPATRIDLHRIELEFKHVSFTYPESTRQVLKDVSFTVRPGEKLAIVGPNGAGKTTIVKLLSKFYEPSEGVILINGIDLRTLDGAFWRWHLSNLSQDVPHFFMPPKENVVIGDQQFALDEHRYRASIQQATLVDDIARLPQGDDTPLGKYFPGGINFSGGQWQKLSIARSFYRQAPLLILDEPTSAIDTKAEQAIMDEIFRKDNQQTQLIVSHKFSNIKKADRIIVLSHGEIIEHGNHKQLLAKDGEYASLYRLQSAAFTES